MPNHSSHRRMSFNKRTGTSCMQIILVLCALIVTAIDFVGIAITTRWMPWVNPTFQSFAVKLALISSVAAVIVGPIIYLFFRNEDIEEVVNQSINGEGEPAANDSKDQHITI